MSTFKKNQIRIHNWGTIDFGDAWQKQELLFNQNLSFKKQGLNAHHHLILCEHPPVYTIGKSGKVEHLLINKDEREKMGADLYRINRGGDITFHGPGQLVVYPILDLESINMGIREYVYTLEESIIKWLYREYGIQSGRLASHTGVWLEPGSKNERKIAAIGIRSSRYITMHGAAINISTDLRFFDKMVPCGIQNKGISSVENELGKQIVFEESSRAYTGHFLEQFRLEPFFT